MKNKKEGGTTEGTTLTFVRIDFSAGRPTHRRCRSELSSNLEEDAANDPQDLLDCEDKAAKVLRRVLLVRDRTIDSVQPKFFHTI